MHKSLQIKFRQNPKMKDYLKQNSMWYKDLNRTPQNYKKFENAIKDMYKLRTTDKISNAIDNIDLVNNVLNILK